MTPRSTARSSLFRRKSNRIGILEIGCTPGGKLRSVPEVRRNQLTGFPPPFRFDGGYFSGAQEMKNEEKTGQSQRSPRVFPNGPSPRLIPKPRHAGENRLESLFTVPGGGSGGTSTLVSQQRKNKNVRCSSHPVDVSTFSSKRQGTPSPAGYPYNCMR